MKKLWGSILTLLAILATYIGVNQFTNRRGDSYTPEKRKPPEKTQGGASRNTDDYGLGLPPNAGNGAGTRNTDTPKK